MKPGRKPKDQLDDKGKWKPTPEQERCVNMLLIGTERQEIIKQLNISEVTYYNWLKDEKYLIYLSSRRNMNYAGIMPAIDNSLIKKALGDGKNSVVAIRTVMERMGEINGAEVKQPITIIFQAKADGSIKRPYPVAKDVTGEQCQLSK